MARARRNSLRVRSGGSGGGFFGEQPARTKGSREVVGVQHAREIGARIRDARHKLSIREKRPVSQRELAERLVAELRRMGVRERFVSVDQRKISLFEAGHQEPTVNEFLALQDVTGVRATYLAFNLRF